MPNADNLYIPPDPQDLLLRPLNKGMVRNIPADMIPVGGVYTAKNMIPTKGGLRRRPALSYYAGGNQVSADDQPLLGIAPFWKTDGTQVAVLLTSRFLYIISAYSSPSVTYWAYEEGLMSVSGSTVTGYGTEWSATANYLQAGDVMVLDADGTPEETIISGITADTTISLTASPSGTYTATDYIENGSCESASSPTLDGGASNLANATWARSDVQQKYGSYSWLLTKDGTGNTGVVWLDDVGETATNDMHGLTAGSTYNIYAWLYTDAADVSNAVLEVREYYSASWHTTATLSATTAEEWDLDSDEVTLNAGTTGVTLKISIDGAEVSKLLYVDGLVLISGGVDYSIRRRFTITGGKLLDTTVCDNKLVVTDYCRPLYSYDGSTFGIYDTDVTYIPGCVVFFADRLWIGNTIESGLYYKQRIRWSSATDHTTFGASDYYDLPYGPGELVRLLPLGPLLIAYFKDAIFIGQQTNNPNLPYAFPTKVDTGGIGLVGPRAVTSAPNGHYFVGQDDVYFLSNNGLKAMDCPVKEEMIGKCETPSGIWVTQDPKNSRILFGVPSSGDQIDKIWSFNTTTGAWAYDDIPATSLSNPLLELGLTIADLDSIAATVADLDTYFATIGDMESTDRVRKVFVTSSGYIYTYSDSGTEDPFGRVGVLIETGDIDLDAADVDKTALKVSLKLSERPSADLDFTVTGSVDGGYTWYPLNHLLIPSDKREGKVDFSLTGSVVRFRFVESSIVGPWEISEAVVRIAGRGEEYEFD
jgi:hypothetical protein